VFYKSIAFLNLNLSQMKLKWRKFHLNIWNFFTARMIEDWNRLLR